MPFIADLKPSGKFVMEDLHNVRLYSSSVAAFVCSIVSACSCLVHKSLAAYALSRTPSFLIWACSVAFANCLASTADAACTHGCRLEACRRCSSTC